MKPLLCEVSDATKRLEIAPYDDKKVCELAELETTKTVNLIYSLSQYSLKLVEEVNHITCD